MGRLVNLPRTTRGKATLNKILSAAAGVFYQKGYNGANIHDIARAAGVATGTFYIYFDGKYNLYKYLLLQCSHQIRKHLSISIQNCATRREAERAGLKSWLEFTVQNPYMYNIIWESLYVDRELFEEYYATFCRAYCKGLELAQDAGEVRPIDPEVMAYTFMGAASFLGLHWGLFNSGQNLDHVVDEFMKILEGGIFLTAAPVHPPAKKQPAPAPGKLLFNVEVDEEFWSEMEN